MVSVICQQLQLFLVDAAPLDRKLHQILQTGNMQYLQTHVEGVLDPQYQLQ